MDATLEGGRARDRRHTVRQSGTDLSWLRELQLRPGHDAILVNLSAGGALVETPTRLSPGTRAVLRLSTASCRWTAAQTDSSSARLAPYSSPARIADTPWRAPHLGLDAARGANPDPRRPSRRGGGGSGPSGRPVERLLSAVQSEADDVATSVVPLGTAGIFETPSPRNLAPRCLRKDR